MGFGGAMLRVSISVMEMHNRETNIILRDQLTIIYKLINKLGYICKNQAN